MFGRSSKKHLEDYIEEHEPFHEIEYLKRPEYLEETVTPEHKNLETDVAEYFEILHPLIQDFLNSWAITYETTIEKYEDAKDDLQSARRQITFEQQNVNELTDELRDVRKTLQEEATVRRDLEERLNDQAAQMEAKFEEEKRALELMASDKVPEDASLEEILDKVKAKVKDSAEVQRLQDRVQELEEKIEKERKENEKIQEELSESFMQKVTKQDEMINNLKDRLEEN